MARRELVFTCSCCHREMRTSDSRRGFRQGMCRQCRTDSESEIDDCGIEFVEEVRSPAEDHDHTYNGGDGVELDYDDVSWD